MTVTARQLVWLALMSAKNKQFRESYFSRWNRLEGLVGKDCKRYKKELDSDTAFLRHIKSNMSPVRGGLWNPGHPDQLFPLYALYIITRILKPKVFVETGVASGTSTAFILKAMEANDSGKLYSIDLPNADQSAAIPRNRQPGWIVPEHLKGRWELIIGSSSEKLPPLLKRLKTIEVFLHDSDHSYQNMIFEFGKAWNHLIEGGLLLSDDYDCNSAFPDFCKRVGKEGVQMRRIAALKR